MINLINLNPGYYILSCILYFFVFYQYWIIYLLVFLIEADKFWFEFIPTHQTTYVLDLELFVWIHPTFYGMTSQTQTVLQANAKYSTFVLSYGNSYQLKRP